MKIHAIGKNTSRLFPVGKRFDLRKYTPISPPTRNIECWKHASVTCKVECTCWVLADVSDMHVLDWNVGGYVRRPKKRQRRSDC